MVGTVTVPKPRHDRTRELGDLAAEAIPVRARVVPATEECGDLAAILSRSRRAA